MPRVWNIGNTTVRNPKRIESALKVFVEEGFSGNIETRERQAQLIEKYDEKQVVIYGNIDREFKELNGRKWRAAFYQLGFISYEEYNIKGTKLSAKRLFENINIPQIDKPYQITPSGLKLISATSIPEIEDIYTRQFSCYELPNSLEGGFPEGVRMKPFILFLQVLKLLQDEGIAGLNKYETGLFLHKFRHHTASLPRDIVNEIIQYRKDLAECKNPKEEQAVKSKYKKELEEAVKIDPGSVLRDYSDTTFRYFSLSGLFTRIGDAMIIRSNKMDFVNKLLIEEPYFLFTADPIDYFRRFYGNSFSIPTDNVTTALDEINFLKKGVRDAGNPLVQKSNSLNPETPVEIVQQVRYELIEYNNWEREEDYAKEQQSDQAITETLAYLKSLNGEKPPGQPDIDDRPAYLEWAVWRSFLAVDEIQSPIHETRRFPVDQDFKPRNTAPGGGSDLIFEFDTYVLVIEVTLTISNRQMAVESEPVRRHTVNYKEIYPDKDVYCLFIAPEVDNNVAETFRIGIWYDKDEEQFVNIVPMSLSDFINAVGTLLHNRFKNGQFKSLLDRCLIFRNVRAPQWKKMISREVNDWKKKIMNNQLNSYS